jgi:hypothetical protein
MQSLLRAVGLLKAGLEQEKTAPHSNNPFTGVVYRKFSNVWTTQAAV